MSFSTSRRWRAGSLLFLPAQRWYNAGVITGTTSPKQVEECLEAFRLETLPEELCAAIDAIHEQYRSPTTTLVNKALLLAAPWVERADECATVA